MGTFNFSAKHNSPHKAVFCTWEDHYKYKEQLIQEYGEEKARQFSAFDDKYGYSDFFDSEKEWYMEQLKLELEKAFGHTLKDMNANARDGQEVCRVGHTWTFGGMNFYTEVGIYLEAGYYEGFALDWEINEMLDCYTDEIPDTETAISYLEDNMNPGMAKMLAGKFIKKCERELKSITDKIDTILMELAPHNMEIGWCCAEYKTA